MYPQSGKANCLNTSYANKGKAEESLLKSILGTFSTRNNKTKER